ncbi:enoyl-CoA hydratase/carnithine racemase-like [Bacillus phage vB_BcoS-136]|uniref:Protein OPG091 n=1 Tax=Bacillus phage vB_BcoS-136 TaxID=2419619 RepID=A0A3G3BVS9_9CAUD|nr:enoyl-CoA hydratase/carnithine racemase-like [Bacillus phage vB_BcoS-136]AYP68261.1 putative cell wall-associated hydrolase [Bacillus phage vB_BcoS-136]
MIGDVLFFKANDSLISRIIASITKSHYTHVGLIVSYDEMTRIATIIESDRFVKTRLRMIDLDEEVHVVYTTGEKDEKQIAKILEYAYKSLGTRYDYLQIIGLFISLLFKKGERNNYFNRSNKLICSELIDLSYYKAGVKRLHNDFIGNITPQELLDAYEFTERKG